jgi:hypothetical protein
MDNPEKLESEGTQDEEKQSKNATQYGLDTTIRIRTIVWKICSCYTEYSLICLLYCSADLRFSSLQLAKWTFVVEDIIYH